MANLNWDDNAKNNMTATTDPTVNDDTTQAYSATPTSHWFNTTSGTLFTCVSNATGAAVWANTSTGDNPTFTNLTVLQNLIARTFRTSPAISQNITAVGDTFNGQNSHLEINPDADYVMTSTPTITAGVDGDILFIHNISAAFTVDIQDNAVLAGSDVFLGGGESTIQPQSIIILQYETTGGTGWHLASNPNTAIAGANASTIEVRNTSGGAIPLGSIVYVDGFNVGQNRILIDLADANDANKMPAIGFVAATIGNGANGQVITSGNAIGLINTAAVAINQGVWVDSAVPGGHVFVRPSVDYIQRIATVTRVNANGNILVQGAGRVNDTPKIIPNLTTTTTQAPADNSTRLATTAYVDTNLMWVMMALGHADFQIAANNNAVPVYTLPPKTAIVAVYLAHQQEFLGGAIATYTLSVGIAGTLQKFANNFDVFQIPGGTVFAPTNNLAAAIEDYNNPVDILVNAISTGATLDASIQGAGEIQILISTLIP